MAQELAKVDVEHVTSGAQHNVVIMTITDAQYVGCHAATCTRVDEVFGCLKRGRRESYCLDGYCYDVM